MGARDKKQHNERWAYGFFIDSHVRQSGRQKTVKRYKRIIMGESQCVRACVFAFSLYHLCRSEREGIPYTLPVLFGLSVLKSKITCIELVAGVTCIADNQHLAYAVHYSSLLR